MFKKDYKNYVIATVATCALFFMIYLYLCRNSLTAEKDKKEQKKPESKTGKDKTPKTAVKNNAQMVKGKRVMLIPLVRMFKIVVI